MKYSLEQNLQSLSSRERSIRSLAASLLRGKHADVDDVTQDVWLRALRSKQNETRWFRKVTINRVREIHRTNKNRQRREMTQLSELAPATDQLAEKAEIHRALIKSLLELKEPYRRTLLLRFFENHSAYEISELDGVPLATVRTRIRRGILELRGELEGRIGGDWRTSCCLVLGVSTFTRTDALLGSIVVSAKSNTVFVVGVALAISIAAFFAFQFMQSGELGDDINSTEHAQDENKISRRVQNSMTRKDELLGANGQPETNATLTTAKQQDELNCDVVFVTVPRSEAVHVGVTLSEVAVGEELPRVFKFSSSRRARVPSGKWRIVTSDENWRAEPMTVETTAADTTIVWLVRSCKVSVRCIDVDGSPIPKAEVSWIPTADAKGKRIDVYGKATTDEEGRATLSPDEQVGTLQILALGYRLQNLQILTEPKDEVVVVLDKRSVTDHKITVIDAVSGNPVAGARLLGTQIAGQAGHMSDHDGLLYVDSHVGFGRGFVLRAAGYLPLTCGPGELSNNSIVHLYPLTPIQFLVVDANGQGPNGAKVFLTTISEPRLASSLTWAQKGDVDEHGMTTLELPQGATSQVFAELPDGRNGSAEVGPNFSDDPVTIVVRTGKTLVVHVKDSTGRPIGGAQVHALWKGRGYGPSRNLKSNEQGKVFLVNPENLQSFHVSKPGWPPVHIERDPMIEVFPGGDVDVLLEKPHTLKGRLISRDRMPVTGLQVTIWFGNRISTKEIHERERLRTIHPSWVHEFPRPVSAVSGPDGTFTINGLPSGNLQVTTEVPRILDPDQISSHDSTLIELSLPHLGVRDFVIDELRLLSLTVLAADTMIPIQDFRMKRTPESLTRGDVHNRGRWEGWIPCTTESVEIFAAGYESSEIVLPQGKNLVHQTVRLKRAEPQRLIFKGAAVPGPGERIGISVLKGQTHKGQYVEYIAWRGSILIADSGPTPLSIPWPKGTKIYIDGFTKNGKRFKFESPTFTFSPGERISLSAVLKNP